MTKKRTAWISILGIVCSFSFNCYHVSDTAGYGQESDTGSNICDTTEKPLWDWAIGIGSDGPSYLRDMEIMNGGVIIIGSLHSPPLLLHLGSSVIETPEDSHTFLAHIGDRGELRWITFPGAGDKQD